MAGKIVLQKLGGSYQLVIGKPEDLEKVRDLDQARWMATSVPVEGLTCDGAFLKYIDYDSNGRIRSDELTRAIDWTLHMLSDRSGLADGTKALKLDAIDTSHDEGRAARAAAELILKNTGAAEADGITLGQVRDRKSILASGATNGDGVIPPGAVEDEALAAFVRDVMDTQGSLPDASGPEGVGAGQLKSFLDEGRGFVDWSARASIPEGADSTEIMVWGEATPAAAAAVAAVRGKLDEFFSLSAMARIDPRIAARATLSEEELAAIDVTDRAAVDARTAAAPLSPPTVEEALELNDLINPAWRKPMAAFAEKVLNRSGGAPATRLERDRWEGVKSELAGYDRWLAGKKGASVEPLGAEKLAGYLEGDLPSRLQKLIDDDREIAGELAGLENVERLVLCQQWLMEFANNFVSFPYLYDPSKRSLVEYGTLVMDGRRFGLCVKVVDRAEHKRVAQHSHICMLYLEVTGRNGAEEKFEAAAAVTSGTTEMLQLGKRGVFFTRDGREWDARVVEVLENPVSLAEALKRPFVKLAGFVGRQAERFTSSAYGKLEAGVGAGIGAAEKGLQPPAGPAAGVPGGNMGFLLLGGGIGVAAIGSAAAYAVEKLASVSLLLLLKVAGVVFLVVAVPTLLVAWFKLRRRNVSMVLEACGWAVNADMRLTRRLGPLFTREPGYPEGARMKRHDLAKALARSLPESHGALTWVVCIALSIAAGAAAGYFIFWKMGLSLAILEYFGYM